MTTNQALEESTELLERSSWTGPIVFLTICTIGLGFYAGTMYMRMGLFLGCASSLAIIILLAKTPRFFQDLCHDHALAADIILSSLATWGIAAFFGQGLTLGISAVTTALILSWAIPAVTRPNIWTK